MSESLPVPENRPLPVLAALLPGPGRKRGQSSYVYRLLYRNPNPAQVGCVMTWEVQGGRLTYQVAVEREKGGRLRCHCTCADSVFRAEPEGRYCKHIKGFLAWGQSLGETRGEGPGQLRKGA
jgi:hypothetical protein